MLETPCSSVVASGSGVEVRDYGASLYPSPFPPEGVPAPTNYPTVATNIELATGLVAARHVQLSAPAREADFEACVAALRAALPGVAKGAFRVFEEGFYTPAYAYFYAEAEKKDFDVECWVEVESTVRI